MAVHDAGSGKRAPSIRGRLAVLVLASAVPAALLAAALLAHEHRSERERLERDMIATTRAMVAVVDTELTGVRQALFALASSPYLSSGDFAAFHAQAATVAGELAVANLVLIDEAGRQRVNTIRSFGAALPARTNPQLAPVVERGEVVVTDLFIGPLAGEPFIAVGVPVRRDGRIVYSLNAGVSPVRLSALLAQQRLPEGWIGAVFDSTGTVVARTHDNARFVGKKGAPELVQRMSERAEGSLDAITLEGIPVVSFFSRSPASGWTVALGIPRESLAAALWRRSAAAALAAAAVLGLGLALAWAIGGRIARSIRGLSEPAARIGLGGAIDVPPLGLREADEVGEALARASRMISSAEYRAQHDPLTGLANRALFAEVAAHQFEVCKRASGPLSLLFVDLDGFKQVNDTLGHDAGDALLREVAARLTQALRASDLAARVGGDEFAVLLGGADAAAAAAIAAKLAEALAAPCQVAGRSLSVTASIGVASYPGAGASAEELMRRADEAMYRVKSGRRRWRA